ncbi:hypothetical protein A0U91_13975 [Acetobacter persici]|uniref:Nucleoside phosphorylase domain-containing protein n=2 Tax=Acetobacter persici TaxID=1076596 RepID=A0A1U9LHK5_9PROT|nr:hypothetical protein A0U91_13975 [Acetobacter persici]
MKILIVDDNPRRYNKLTEELLSFGLGLDNLDVVVCTRHAVEKLEVKHYDLLILDLVIPLNPTDLPSEHNSVDLLMQIAEGDFLIRPSRIVGLTADKAAAVRAAPSFGRQLWSIIEFRDDNDEWLYQVRSCVDYGISSASEASVVSYDIDVCILCALHQPELDAVLRLPIKWESSAHPIDDVTFVHEGTLDGRKRQLKIVAAAATRMGMVSSSLLASKLIGRFRPRLLAMTGICAGVKGKVSLGDVIVADPCWDWQSGKRRLEPSESAESKFEPSSHHLPLSESLRSRFHEIKKDRDSLEAIRRAWPVDIPTPLRVEVAPMASGSVVLADDVAAGRIKEQHRQLSAIEMEAYGVYAAAAMACAPKPEVVAIKSVCDFAGPDKSDTFQPYAAYTSASVLKLYIDKYFE